MRTWTEYCENVGAYYDWISHENKNLFKNLCVLSFNASGIESRWDEFYQYCAKQIFHLLKEPERYSVYVIASEKIKDKNSKVEHYKKCWKKLSSNYDISKFELGEEILYTNNDESFYAGIARTSLHNLIDALRIVNAKGNKYIIFISKNDASKQFYMSVDHMKKYMVYNQYGDVDYSNCFLQSCLVGDISVRYGTSFTEVELALIFNRYDYSTIINAI